MTEVGLTQRSSRLGGRLGGMGSCAARLGSTIGIVFVASAVHAQTSDVYPPGSLRIGPLLARPTIAVTDLGVDNNVFYEEADQKRDIVFTAIPGAELRGRIGLASIRATSRVTMRYFHTYANQRSIGPSQDMTVELPVNRLTVSGMTSISKDRERPSLDVTLRAKRLLFDYQARATYRLFSKTSLGVGVRRSRTGYADDAGPGERALAAALNRTDTAWDVTGRHAVTPFTSLVVQAQLSRDTFDASVRDTSGSGWTVGVVADRAALVSGSASFGRRRTKTPDPLQPIEFNDWTFAAVLSTVIRGTTRLSLATSRGLQYSVEPTDPYLLNRSAILGVTQRVTSSWEVSGSGGWQSLIPTSRRLGAPINGSLVRLDGATYQFGVSYVLASGLRLGLDGRHWRRTSLAAGGDYVSWRLGATLSYGY